ncbi:MAG TPA: 3-carboxy-cis,cis-muconate cycloisomerase [Pseudolabrys sp.]|nr:3-carboxy-cis,cis-muconate cycloisomerase [Pseudolabrys sp.]
MAATIFDSHVFRNVFTTEAMRQVWSDESRVQKYLDFEAALAKAQAKLKIIPQEAADEIVKHCHASEMDMAKLKEATERIGYPVLPVVQQLVKACKDKLGEWSHWGATTQDITDTATVLQIKEALALVEQEIDGICDALAALAKKYRDTPMAGRSNLQQAVPITFGYKMATMLAAFQRHKQRLNELKPRVLVGEFGGAAGTLSSLGKDGLKCQEGLMQELGLGQPDISWHTVRDRIAEVGCFLGLVTGSCGKIAFDVKLLMQTEVEEVQEPFHQGRGSSSTMPQKRNPISSVYITAQTAMVKQLVAALLEAQIEDHERSTGPWEIEWIALPEIFLLAAGALTQTRFVVEGLQVNEQKMRDNLFITKGLLMSEAVMMGLGDKMGRNYAHDVVYDICREVVKTGRPLIDLLEENDEIKKYADRKTLEKLIEPSNYLGVAGEMVDRVLAKQGK